jgi:hypothetical protein
MTIPNPAAFEIAAAGALVLPVADDEPLEVAHRNANALITLYRPPMRSVVYTDEASSVGARVYRIAIQPSADAIPYRFRHIVRTGTGTTAIDVEVEWQTAGGGYTSIYSASTAAGASTVVSVSHTATIPAAADELRITYDRGADPYMADSVLITPEAAMPSARTSSGAWVYDDGVLAATGAPINTELVTRPWRTTAAIIADRALCIAGFTQRSDTDAMYEASGGSAPDDTWALMGAGIAAVPYAPATVSVDVAAIASSAIASADRVRIVVGGVAVTLDSSDAVETATLTGVLVQQPGTLGASVSVEVYVLADRGDLLYLHDACAWVQPWGSSALPLATTDTDPAATMQLLHAVVRETERRCMAPWPQVAHMFDGITSGLTSRRWTVSVPPACQRARLALVRSGPPHGTLQTSTTIETTETSGVPASPGTAIVTVPTHTRGSEAYLAAAAGEGTHVIIWSSDSYDVSGVPPASTADRQLELAEALAPGVEVVQTGYCCGAALHYVRVRPQADYSGI